MFNANLHIASSTETTSYTTGALTVNGGIALGGNLYIGSTTDSTDASSGAVVIAGGMGINGHTYSSGNVYAVSFQDYSDYRIKDNVTLLNGTYNVDKLRPVSYHNKLSNMDDLGFIAHEVQDVYPCLVNGEKDGKNYQSLNYIGIIPILVKEIQDLKKEVENLKQKIM